VISWRVRQALFLLMAAFVAWAEGPANPYWVWNCMPIAISYVLLKNARERNVMPLPEIAFFFVACGVVLFAHAALLDPILGAASDWPIPMLALLPILAVALGGVAFGLVFLFSKRRHQEKI